MRLKATTIEAMTKRIAEYARFEGKSSILFTRPHLEPLNLSGTKLEPLEKDVVQLSKQKFALPSTQQCEEILSRNNLSAKIVKGHEIDVPYLNDNNRIFLARLEEMFPPQAGEPNRQLEKRLVYLEDINHKPFQDKEQFLTKFLEDVKEVEQMTDLNGKTLYGGQGCTSLYSKKAFIEAKYNNPERHQELTDLYKLYKEGKVPEYLLGAFFPKARFHQLPKQDIEKLLKGENYFPQFPEKVSGREISKLSVGEVFQIGKDMFVKTKKQSFWDNGYEKLKMDEETYRKLFPPVIRHAIAQNDADNCGKIAALNAIIKHPETRVKLYRMFEQTPSGVRINLPELGTMEFTYGNLDMLHTDQNLQGGLGHKMLEYAHDFKKHGKLDILNGARTNMVNTLTGYTHNRALATRYIDTYLPNAGTALAEEAARIHTSGIYTFRDWGVIPNYGVYENHAFSATTLPYRTGEFQSPWSGLEVIPYKRNLLPNCCSGTLVDVK